MMQLHALLIFIAALLACPQVAPQSTILSVSVFNSCTNVALTNATLNCTKTAGRVTIVNVLVEASGNTATTGFDFAVTAVPSSADQIQRDTTDTCTITGSNGQCSVTNRVRFFFTAQRPVIRNKLIPVSGLLRNPFQIPWAYTYLQKINKPAGVDDSSLCYFSRTYGMAGSAKTPSNATISNLFTDPTKNANCIRCADGTPSSSVQNTCTNALAYSLQCLRAGPRSVYENVQLIAQFCELAPLCSVYAISRNPEVVGRLNVTAVNTATGETIELTLDSVGSQSSIADPQGRLLISVVGDVSANAYVAPSIPGLIVVCNQSGSINMVPDGFNPSTNPWRLANERAGFNNKYRLPTSGVIKALSGKPCDSFCGYYYIPPVEAQAVGARCGCLGVDPNLYAYPPDSLYFDYYDLYSRVDQNKISTPTMKLGDLKKLGNVFTCVPGFGSNFGNINVTTPCNANGYMKVNDGNTDLNVPEHMPPGYNMPEPRSWLQDLYYYTEVDTPISYQVQIQGSVEFLGIVGTVSKGAIDPVLSACYVNNTNPSFIQPSLTVRVNNLSPSNSQSSFSIFTTCTGGLEAQAQVNTQTLSGGTGQLVVIPVRLGAFQLSDDAACTVELYSSSALVDPRSVRMQALTLGCLYKTTIDPTPPPIPFNISQFAVDRKPPGSAVTGDKTSSQIAAYIILGTFIAAMVVIFVTVIVGCTFNLSSRNTLKRVGIKT